MQHHRLLQNLGNFLATFSLTFEQLDTHSLLFQFFCRQNTDLFPTQNEHTVQRFLASQSHKAIDVFQFLDCRHNINMVAWPQHFRAVRNNDLLTAKNKSNQGVLGRPSPVQILYSLSGSPTVVVNVHAKQLHPRSEEHTSELQSRVDLVCRLL